MNIKNQGHAKRRLIKQISTASGTLLIAQTQWTGPVVKSVVLPAHAASTCQGNEALSGPISGTASALLSAPDAGNITVCVDGLGFQSGTFENPGTINELVVNFPFQGCIGQATLSGQIAGGTVSGSFSYTLTCPSGECSGSGTWGGINTDNNPLLYTGNWSGTQTCCGDPEFVIGRDTIPFVCPLL